MTEPGFLRATRSSYDAVAGDYVEFARDELSIRPLERALLAAFAEFVCTAELGPIADVGCGTGRVTAHLAALGVPVFGVDLSPGMIAVARREHPRLRFEVGSMLDLDLPDGGLGGVLAWYSTIHVPDEHLPAAFAEFFRVLSPGGYLQLGFQAGDGSRHLTEALGHVVELEFRRRRPGRVAELLREAGFAPHTRVEREADPGGRFPERTAQGFVLARKPVAVVG